MKKLLYVALSCFVFIWSGIKAGIIGGTKWVNGSKSIIVYFDGHTRGTPEQWRRQFMSVQESVSRRDAPLLMLVENYISDNIYKDGVTGVSRFQRADDRFLFRFSPFIGDKLSEMGLVKSFEARTLPFLAYFLFNNELASKEGRAERFPIELLTTLNELFNKVTFEQIFDVTPQFDYYIEETSNETIRKIFLEQKKKTLECVDVLRQFLIGRKVDAAGLHSKPLRQIFDKLGEKRSLFMSRDGIDLWLHKALGELTNARMLWDVVHARGDVAVFAGATHAVALEGSLAKLGYVEAGIKEREQVEYLRKSYFDRSISFAGELKLISTAAFDWIK